MSIKINGVSKRIGLGLSGGGFRAAGFHLGVLLKLKKLNLLDKIDLFSCVSGGSIAGAYYLIHRDDPKVLDNLEKFLTTKSIDITSTLEGIFNPFKTTTEVLSEKYREFIFDNNSLTLSNLKDGPRVYFNSTNLSSGNAFYFVSGKNSGLKGSYVNDIGYGEWHYKFHKNVDWPLEIAVAASSAFPPVYSPLKLSKRDYPQKHARYVTLSDGGVYDNMGINPLIRKKNELDYIIVSDAGKPFVIDKDPSENALLTLKRALDIALERVNDLSFYRMMEAFKSNGKPQPIWFQIDSNTGAAKKNDPVKASKIDTRLKKLSKSEMELLKRHGGALVHSRLKMYMLELINAAKKKPGAKESKK